MINTISLDQTEVLDILTLMDELYLPNVRITKESNGMGISTSISYESSISCSKHEYQVTTTINMTNIADW